MQFLPCITTTAGSSWESKINEAKELQIDEVAVFPTCLDVETRKKLYFALEKSYIKKIPFVHLRNDTELWEIEYFIKKFNTSIFNIHSVHQNGEVNPELIKFKNIICVENHHIFDDEELSKWGGICLDFAHMENEIMLNENKEAEFLPVIQKHPIRCGHISAIKNAFKVSETGEISYDSHSLSNLSELDYLRRYPVAYFDNYCAIELENGLAKQLEVIKYIKELLSFRDELIKKIF